MSDARRRGGTYGVYDRMGDFVGTVCADAGRALIGGETYLRDAPDREPLSPVVDREALLSLSDDLDGAARDAGDVGPVAEVFRDIARNIREACGEVVE